MMNNLLIQFGTSLEQNVIFSSLRQDLIRRMLNCNRLLPMDERVNIIDEYIQLMSNSGHSYTFTKAVVLQALTKYKSILERADLKEEDERFIP